MVVTERGTVRLTAVEHASGHDALYEWAWGLKLPVPPRSNACSPDKVKRLLQLEAEGLQRVVIAERLGLHVNTVTKYLRLAGRALYPYADHLRGKRRR